MKKKMVAAVLFLAGIGCSSFYLMQNWTLLTKNPFNRTLSFEYSSFVSSDAAGNHYVIDKSRRRVISCDKNGVVLAVIEGGSKEKGSFFYANEAAADADGRIYIINWVLDKSGFFMDREEILRYLPDGSFDRVIYVKQYDESSRVSTLVQRGQISSLSISGDLLRWFDIDANGIWSYCMTISSSAVEKTLTADIPEANLLVTNAVRSDAETIVYGTKKGQIIERRRGSAPVVRYAADNQTALSIPWNVASDTNGIIYFSDLEKKSILKVERNGSVVPVLSKSILEKLNITTDEYTYYRLSVHSDGRLSSCNDSYIVTLSPDGKIILYAASLSYPVRLMAVAFSAWLVLLLLLICIGGLSWLFYVNVLNRKIPEVMVKAVGIILVISVSAMLISVLIVQNFSARYQKEALNKIAQMVQIVPKVIDVTNLEKLSRHDQFLGSDYRAIRENLLSSLNYNRDEWNNSYYFVLYRVIGGRLYGFMYLNGDIGIYYPFSYFDDPQSVYQRAFKGEIATERSSDEWGSWLDGVGPIRNREGKVIGLIEIGTDLYSFNQENSRLVREIILDVVTMLVVFVLAMIEITFLFDMLRRRERRIALLAAGRAVRKEDMHSDVYFARPLTFIVFTALSMSVVFIPLMMGTFYHSIPGLSKTMVLGLPISCEMLFFGIASIAAGKIVSRRGWHFVCRLGLVFAGAGLLASGFASGMWSFLCARALAGLGGGLFFMSMRSFIHYEHKEDMRAEAFSHFYSALIVGLSIGAVVGGFAADKLGYSAVFFIAFAILFIAAAFDLAYMRDLHFMENDDVRPDIASLRKSAKIFFSDPKVIGFFLLIIVPTYLASTFLAYFFPIFAEAHNVSSANVGRLFILNGIFIIYLGPVLSRFLDRTLGFRRTMVIGSALWAGALLIVALTGNMAGAVIALVIMGITEGFCVSAQNSFFLALKSSKTIGEDQAVGYFEMIGKFAETLGPILFGGALILGQIAGLSIIALSVFGCAAVYLFLARKNG